MTIFACLDCEEIFERLRNEKWCPKCRALRKAETIKEKIKCEECGNHYVTIHSSHLKTHGMTTKEYKLKYPTAPLMSQKLKQSNITNSPFRTRESMFIQNRIDQVKSLGVEVVVDEVNNVLVFDGKVGEKIFTDRYSPTPHEFKVHYKYCQEKGLQPSIYSKREQKLFRELGEKGYEFHYIVKMIWDLVYADWMVRKQSENKVASSN